MKPVRLGLIGVGRWGRVYIRTLLALQDRCRLTHIATSRPANAALVPHPVTVVGEWRELVAADCDAVIIATPPHTHAEILEACLSAGKPCIVEKPLCLDLPTAERLHRRVRHSKIPVLVDHTHLFSSAYLALKQGLRERREPVRLMFSEGMDLGPLRPDVSALWDWAPHDLSLCLDLMDAVPQRVRALGGPRASGGAPERVSMRLEFAGGAVAWIQAGRLSPWKRRNLSVFTDTQLYYWDDLSGETPTVSSFRLSGGADPMAEPLERAPLSVASRRLSMERMVSYFLDGISGGERRYFGTELALHITRLLAACDAAIQEDS